jgi:electron transfer flavoprotein beta subunit
VNILVLIKQVPDTAARIQDRVKDGAVDLDGVTWVANPYDEFAVEEALQLKEKHGGSVTLVALGPDRVDAALKDMLALGADEAVHLNDSAFDALGPRGVAKVLAAAVRKLPFDMIWTGWKGVDYEDGLVPLHLAAELDLPYVSVVQEFSVEDGKAVVARDVEGGRETLEVPLPALFGAQKGLNEVRYASLKGIMAVKKKQIPVWDAAELGVDVGSLPTQAVTQVTIEAPPERPPGRVLDGSPEEAANELAQLLHEEVKVI